MITSENSSVARESSRVIILKSRLNSACTSEVREIFDRQTHVPNDWWELMCSRVLQPWDRRNSMTAPVLNITTVQALTVRVDLGVMAVKGYSTLPRSPSTLVECHTQDTSLGGDFYPSAEDMVTEFRVSPTKLLYFSKKHCQISINLSGGIPVG